MCCTGKIELCDDVKPICKPMTLEIRNDGRSPSHTLQCGVLLPWIFNPAVMFKNIEHRIAALAQKLGQANSASQRTKNTSQQVATSGSCVSFSKESNSCNATGHRVAPLMAVLMLTVSGLILSSRIASKMV